MCTYYVFIIDAFSNNTEQKFKFFSVLRNSFQKSIDFYVNRFREKKLKEWNFLKWNSRAHRLVSGIGSRAGSR